MRIMKKSISIVVPAYNEAEAIGDVLKNLKNVMNTANWKYEIIVVDDGSTDGTGNITRKIHGIKVISHADNRGYGAALKTGIRNAESERILMIDADGTYDSKEISKLLKHAKEYDMVVGARTGKKVNIPMVRKPAKFFLSLLANYLSGAKIPDLNSGLRIFKKEIALQFFNILPQRFSFTSTLTLACLSNDYSIKYVPVNYYKRKGKSTIHPIKDTINFILLINRTIMYFNPLKVFLPAGSLILTMGLLKLIFVDILLNHNITDLSVVLTFTGVQICFFGLLADVIVKQRT